MIFAEAGMFVSGTGPWTQFLQWADFPGGVRDFLACVSATVAPTERPALICLDALNEAHPRTLWRDGIDNFVAELREYANVKLLVSCRTDYLLHTFPEPIRTGRSSEWTLIHHEGLGASLLEAVPKFLKAYDVRGVGIPPLTREFQLPLLLKIFCEAFRGTQPSTGSLTLSRILAAYLTFKSKQIGDAIDCPPSTVASGVSEHAARNDLHLREMDALVHDHTFAQKFVEPNILIREYAREICEHALQKGALPPHIQPKSFRPPFRSQWPRLWSEAKMNAFRDDCHKHFEANRNYSQLLHSTTPEEPGGYGDWGRYVMGAAVHHFQNRRLSQPPADRYSARFDARICQRYVIQRALQIGLSPNEDDQPIHTRETSRPQIERLGKKYQWVGLHEFIGYLADHYHFNDGSSVQKFTGPRQMLGLRDLLDSHVPESTPARDTTDWNFAPFSPPWWVRPLNPFKHAIGIKNQKQWIIERETEDPAALLSMSDDNDEWIALSGFWEWKEPQPVQRAGSYENPCLNMFWMLRSVVVPEKNRIQVLGVLSQSAYDHDSLLQFDEPTFSSALSELRKFPTKQTDLAEWCEFDRAPRSEAWVTTCRYESHDEAPDGISGSIPSPQLVHLGGLRWVGRDFDFVNSSKNQVLCRFLKQSNAQAALVRKRSLTRCLARTRCRLMWRFHGEKNRYSEPHDECHQRRYWVSYELLPDGSVSCYDGGTHLVANRTRRNDPLPWKTESR